MYIIPKEMRNAFFAGAQHLFSSIINVMDPESEATERDLDRMGKIAIELNAFLENFKKDHGL